MPGNDEPAQHQVTAGPSQAGERLDRLLAGALPDLSRSRLKTLIIEGRVRLGERDHNDPSHRVKPGQVFTISIPPAREAKPAGQAIALDIVYEDDDLIVLDKPAGMVVHPAPGNPDGTLVNALIAHCGASLSGIGGVMRPGIVHRLDKDTSGLMVAAKNDAAHARYLPPSPPMRSSAPIWPWSGACRRGPGRDHREYRPPSGGPEADGDRGARRQAGAHPLPGDAPPRPRREPGGMPAGHRTHPPDPGPSGGARPSAGRRPGLWPRHPGPAAVLEPAARAAVKSFRRQALHADLLGFVHPRTGIPIRWEGQLPQDILNLINSLE